MGRPPRERILRRAGRGANVRAMTTFERRQLQERSKISADSTARRALPRWPLYLIALPAAVAVWSGWVGLGTLCGFGLNHPLPGIWDAATVNTAIALPVGSRRTALTRWVHGSRQVYPRRPGSSPSGALSGRWRSGCSDRSLITFSAQLTRRGHRGLSWCSCRASRLSFSASVRRCRTCYVGKIMDPRAHPTWTRIPHSNRSRHPYLRARPLPHPSSRSRVRARSPPGARQGLSPSPRLGRLRPEFYAAELASGELPSLRRIRADLHVGQLKAQQIQAELTAALKPAAGVAAA